MSNSLTRTTAENQLLRALSRQIGYTTGAYSIVRMAQLVSLFTDSTAYQFELVKILQEKGLDQDEALSPKYASEILNFATSLGILYRLPHAGGLAHLSRFGLTDAGIALRASSTKPLLRQLVLTDLVLQNDADAYILTLQLLAATASSEQLATRFLQHVTDMRVRRLRWLTSAFTNKTLLDRFTARVFWIKKSRLGALEADKPKADFGRHHFGPRKSWAIQLGHFNEKDHLLTPTGSRLLSKFSPSSPPAFWLSPPKEALDLLRLPVPTEFAGPPEPAIDLLRPSLGPEAPPTPHIISSIVSFLVESFPTIRLHHARQASIAAAQYYLRVLEQEVGCRTSWDETLKLVAQQHAELFSFFTNRQGHIAYYQLRKTI